MRWSRYPFVAVVVAAVVSAVVVSCLLGENVGSTAGRGGKSLG